MFVRLLCHNGSPSSLPSADPSTSSSKKKRKRSAEPDHNDADASTQQQQQQQLALSLSYRMLNDAERDVLEREEGGANGFGDEDGDGDESSAFDGDRWLSVSGVPASYDYANVAAALACFGEVGQCLFRPSAESLSGDSRSFGASRGGVHFLALDRVSLLIACYFSPQGLSFCLKKDLNIAHSLVGASAWKSFRT